MGPIWVYAKTQCGVILHYLRFVVWPHLLIVDYGDWPITQTFAHYAQALRLNPSLAETHNNLGVILTE